jgi:hypothetical protein
MLGLPLHDELTAAQRICDELYVMWSAARAEANDAYAAWCVDRGPEAYAVFMAAEDRADAAEREYAAACRRLASAV